MIRVGIVGLGYWGPNLVRCFSDLEDCKVTAVCDQNCDQLLRIKDRFPSVYPVEKLSTAFGSRLGGCGCYRDTDGDALRFDHAGTGA